MSSQNTFKEILEKISKFDDKKLEDLNKYLKTNDYKLVEVDNKQEINIPSHSHYDKCLFDYLSYLGGIWVINRINDPTLELQTGRKCGQITKDNIKEICCKLFNCMFIKSIQCDYRVCFKIVKDKLILFTNGYSCEYDSNGDYIINVKDNQSL